MLKKGKTGGRGRLKKGIKMGRKVESGGRERKVSFAKNNFFTSIDETFLALAALKRGWE